MAATYFHWVTGTDYSNWMVGSFAYLLIFDFAIFLGVRNAATIINLMYLLAVPIVFIGAPVLSLMALIGLGMCLTVPRNSQAFPFILRSLFCLLGAVVGWLFLAIAALLQYQEMLSATMETYLGWIVYGTLPATVLAAFASHLLFSLFLRRIGAYFEDEPTVALVNEHLPLFFLLVGSFFVAWVLALLPWTGPFLAALLGFFVLALSMIVQLRFARCVVAVRDLF